MSDEERILTFPCEFPVKVMGRSSGEFHEAVREVVARHVPAEDQQDLTTQDSSAGRFVSITVVIRARSRDQLDRLYQDLNDLDLVLMTL